MTTSNISFAGKATALCKMQEPEQAMQVEAQTPGGGLLQAAL